MLWINVKAFLTNLVHLPQGSELFEEAFQD